MIYKQILKIKKSVWNKSAETLIGTLSIWISLSRKYNITIIVDESKLCLDMAF